VAGRSAVTLRVAGVEDVVPNGARMPIAELEQRIAALGVGTAVGRVPAGVGGQPVVGGSADPVDRVAGPGGPSATRESVEELTPASPDATHDTAADPIPGSP
jgi:hypothetical protein